MEKEKFKLPAPIFSKVENKLPSPHFASPQGMLLPKEKQPPPMFGPNGATIPAKYLEKYKPYLEKYQKKFEEKNAASKKCSQQTLWCENCEFLFKNKSQLDKHLLDYSNCTIGDCTFHGCSRSVAKHIQELHTTGLYDKIKNLNTPEEIEKWREERKKRYPTMANVQLRQKVQEERKKRGERIENNRNRFGPKNDTRKSNNNASDSQMLKRKGQTKFEHFKKKKIDERRNNAATINNRSQRTNTDSVKNNPEEKMECSDEEEEFSNSNIPKFQGTLSISDYVSSRTKEKKVVKNVLATLVGMYGDSSDSDEDISNSENETNNELPTKLNQAETSTVNNLEKVVQDPEEKEPNNKNDQNKRGQNDFDMKSLKDETDVKDDIKVNIFEEEENKAVSDIESEDVLVEEPILRKLAIDLIPNISQNEENNKNICNLEKLIQTTEEKVPNKKNHESESTQCDLKVKLLEDESVVNDIRITTFEKEGQMKAVSDIDSEDVPDEAPILRKLAINLIPSISKNEENNKNICNLEKLIQTTEEKVPNKKNHESQSTQNDLDVKLLEDESVVKDIRINTFEKDEEMKAVSDTESEDAPDEQPILRKLANNLIPKILQNKNNCNLEKGEQSKKDKLLTNESTENNFDLRLSQDVRIGMFEKEEEVKEVSDTESEDAPDEELILRKLADNIIPKILQNEINENISNLEKIEQSKKDKLLTNESTENNFDLKLSQETVVNDLKTELFEKEEDVKAVSDIEDIPDEKPILRKLADELIPIPFNFPKESKVIKTVENDKIHRDERFSHGGTRNGNSRKSKINSKIRKTGSLLDYSKLRKTPQNTLLEKLLEPQIRHERNVLLQCVRYVVNNNFFETNYDKIIK